MLLQQPHKFSRSSTVSVVCPIQAVWSSGKLQLEGMVQILFTTEWGSGSPKPEVP